MQILVLVLLPALIWAIAPIFYRDFLLKNSTIKVNLYRMFFSSLVLFIPAMFLGFNEGILYALLSGLLTLTVGDSFYLLSVKKVGASIAAPVAYSYVFFSQLAAAFLGEHLKISYIISSLLIIIAIFLISSPSKRVRIGGVLIALLASLFWTTGQAMIKLATLENMNAVSIAFSRVAISCVALGLVSSISYKSLKIDLNKKDLVILAIISVSDLVIGSSLFILSIAYAGLAFTIIVTSISPLLTQIISRLSKKEKPTLVDLAAGFLIFLAIMLTIIY